ncbi:hypothetical protein [Roseomonas populi]|uniref:Uncharacterized protein n=1 Tax=Roseomonas populi TaxID=3121582 RepID=A0ABT1X6D1_9PROT|nr:hypothetical protein [Roseomonas pecuniae]MCR0983661.1 hypothetical protein [Roseomonas pecuniae]
MRVPLPGRDYFPPRVLLRGPARPMPAATQIDVRGAEARGEWPSLGNIMPMLMPASPPTPMAGLQPAAS